MPRDDAPPALAGAAEEAASADAAAEANPAAERERARSRVQVSCSPGFLDWLAEEGIGVAFTTYQTNRLFLVGRDERGRLAAYERLLDRPMGLAVSSQRLWIATRFQLWRFDQVLAEGDRYRGHDRLFVPRIGQVTGELDVHDVQLVAEGGDCGRGGAEEDTDGGVEGAEPIFVNTLYSCLARLSPRHSFEPLWRPPFVSELVPEDRCHLNGLALDGGRPRFVTAVARTDRAQAWREHRTGGGVVLDVGSGEVVASGFSMPHSPRVHQGELFVLDSGQGELGRVDLDGGRFERIALCPGYLRGLAFRGRRALVGLSKPRDRTFRDLPLGERLRDAGLEPRCALWVIDLDRGEPLHWLEIAGVVLELYDVAIVPGCVRPMALGFKSDELRRTITFEVEGRSIRHSLRRLEAGDARVESSPLPRRRAPTAGADAGADAGVGSRPGDADRALPPQVVARTLELGIEEALAHSDLTFPDLRRTARRRPLREPLLATVLAAAPAPASMVADAPASTSLAAAVTMLRPAASGAEVLSLVVRSDLRGRGLGKLLLAAVEAEMTRRGQPSLDLAFRDNWASAAALRALLRGRGWSEPATQALLVNTDRRILELPWLEPRPLPEGYEIFPWSELSASERREMVGRQQRDPWYPDSLTPFQLEEGIDREVSVGLRHDGRVIGWLLAHRVKDDLVQYTSLFVEAGHAKVGRGLALIAAAAQRQAATAASRAIFMVQSENHAMRRLLERRLAPYVTERSELMRSGKILAPRGAQGC